MTYNERFARISQQAAYSRRVEAFGLEALIAPYIRRTPEIPEQATSRDDCPATA